MERNELEMMRATVATMRGEWAESLAMILKYFPQNADAVRVERLRNVFASMCRIHKIAK
jgi:hypothetical protein